MKHWLGFTMEVNALAVPIFCLTEMNALAINSFLHMSGSKRHLVDEVVINPLYCCRDQLIGVLHQYHRW